jgi:hypothetical protein
MIVLNVCESDLKKITILKHVNNNHWNILSEVIYRAMYVWSYKTQTESVILSFPSFEFTMKKHTHTHKHFRTVKNLFGRYLCICYIIV